ncbi:Lrp/AsnC family transcriptional regulator [Candidatus Bathyarchaeota archaeon]|nr:Lrp/AsnC family transcriptional regulator [Candidatus Bathyarchaeota archaeon]
MKECADGGIDLESESSEKIDKIDLQIISLLQEDSRLSFNKMAKELGVSVGTVCNRIKILEEKGIIKGYTAVVNPIKIGYGLTAIILIQAEGKHLVDVEREVAKMKHIVSVYDITGDFDIAVIARFKDIFGLNTFIKRLLAMPYVKRTVTNVVLNVVKEDFRVKIS